MKLSRPRSYLGRVAQGHPRLIAGILIAAVVYLVEAARWDATTRLLIAWNIATVFYIAATGVTMWRATPKSLRWRAKQTDEGRFAILFLVSLAALAAIAAIIAELGMTKDLKGTAKALHLGLAGLTILTAWTFIHLSYTLHYAHEYFDETKTDEGEKPQLKGGINFPETDEPDYWDFAYFSFIIGVAAQTADVSITSKEIRRTSLFHSILAFFFNSAILALTINIASGLI